MKRILTFILVLALCLVLCACGCEHEYDGGIITTEATCFSKGVKTLTCKLCGETRSETTPMTDHIYDSKTLSEATFTETGLIEFTCVNCGESYTEELPVRDDEVVVSVTSKENLPENYDVGRYSDRISLDFLLENRTDNDIKGIQGTLTVKDLFGDTILTTNCDFTGTTIYANSTSNIEDLGMDVNPFIDSHTKFYNETFEDLQFEYEVTNVVYANENNPQSNATNADQRVSVNVTDKYNLEENYDEWRFSPRVVFTFAITNNTEKDIKGIQGTLMIKDMFGSEIMAMGCDFTGETFYTGETLELSDLGFDVNEFIDSQLKVYNELYEDLIFEYTVTRIIYTDGTSE